MGHLVPELVTLTILPSTSRDKCLHRLRFKWIKREKLPVVMVLHMVLMVLKILGDTGPQNLALFGRTLMKMTLLYDRLTLLTRTDKGSERAANTDPWVILCPLSRWTDLMGSVTLVVLIKIR